MKKIFFISGIILFLIIIVFIVKSFLDFKPFMENIFENGINLEEKQKLIKTNIILNKNNETFILNFDNKDTVNLYFFNIKYQNLSSKETQEILSKINNEKNNYYIFTDTINFNFTDFKFKDMIFLTNTDSLPFKYKKLMYPYKVKIFKDSIINSSLNIYEK
jgi:hypothetical protein